ncbi:MAG: plastocyanin/azurin family copper-binding protein [Nitrospirota bacterium]
MKKGIKAAAMGSAFLVLVFALLASCGGGGGGGTPPSPVQGVACPGTPAATVSALTSSFSPTGVTISVNQIVQWNNSSGVAHTVTRTTGDTFNVALNDGTSVCLQFTAAGVYDYYCTIHGPTMDGSVTVNP